MAEDEEVCKDAPPRKFTPSFVEVTCKSSQKRRRFAAGTEAGFAVSFINRKLGVGAKPLALCIEAAKEGEEPVTFGPNAVLVDYGSGWRLQTVTEVDLARDNGKGGFQPSGVHVNPEGSDGAQMTKPAISFLYIAKILIAFLMIFVLGAIFTLALEYLPALIMSVNSFM